MKTTKALTIVTIEDEKHDELHILTEFKDNEEVIRFLKKAMFQFAHDSGLGFEGLNRILSEGVR